MRDQFVTLTPSVFAVKMHPLCRCVSDVLKLV